MRWCRDHDAALEWAALITVWALVVWLYGWFGVACAVVAATVATLWALAGWCRDRRRPRGERRGDLPVWMWRLRLAVRDRARSR